MCYTAKMASGFTREQAVVWRRAAHAGAPMGTAPLLLAMRPTRFANTVQARREYWRLYMQSWPRPLPFDPPPADVARGGPGG
jgi:hypothetical protein